MLDLGFGRHVVPHPPSIRTHNTATAVTCGNRREYMRKGARKLEQCRISGGAEKTMYKHNFDSQRKNVYKHCFCRVARRRPTKKLCLYTVLFWVDAAQHGKKRVYTQFYRLWTKLCLYTAFSAPPEMQHCAGFFPPLVPSYCSRLLFGPLGSHLLPPPTFRMDFRPYLLSTKPTRPNPQNTIPT